jgi:hypothetical protein
MRGSREGGTPAIPVPEVISQVPRPSPSMTNDVAIR